jgi:hypothetical protein
MPSRWREWLAALTLTHYFQYRIPAKTNSPTFGIYYAVLFDGVGRVLHRDGGLTRFSRFEAGRKAGSEQ